MSKISDTAKLKTIKELKAALALQKTWIQRRVKANDTQRDLANNASFLNSLLDAEINRCNESSLEQGEKFEKIAEELLHAYAKEEPTEEVKTAIEGVEESVGNYLDNLGESRNKLLKAYIALQERHKRAADDAIAAGGGHGPAGGGRPAPKENAALRPPLLLHTDTPSVLTAWIKQFKAWFKSSHFDLEPDRDTQLAYFYTWIDDTLSKRIDPLLEVTLPILPARDGDPSCLKVLDEEFTRIYPTFNRRLDFFRYQSTDGQSFTDFATQLESLGSAAELEDIDPDTLFIYRALTGFKDESIRNEFLKLKDPTKRELIDLGQRLESAKIAKQKLQDPAPAYQARSGGASGGSSNGGPAGGRGRGGASRGRGGGGRGGSGGGGAKGDEKKSEKKSERFYCEHCNYSFKLREKLEEHEKTCPAKTGKCDECGLDGHYRPACPKFKK